MTVAAKEAALREPLARLLSWEDAHVSFDAAVADIPEKLRGKQPAGLPHSPWQIVEHLRLAQHDILEFCTNPDYRELDWPDDYWPPSAAPPSAKAWDDSIRKYCKDRKALQQIAVDPQVELGARIPHGTGQTYLRELLLVADHTAYHVGELIVVRRLLGHWKK